MNESLIARRQQASTRPIEEIDPELVSGLRLAEVELHKHSEDLRSEWDQPLRVNEQGFIVQGVAWIPPFEYDFWSWRRKKPKPVKCTCTECGHKHNLKGW